MKNLKKFIPPVKKPRLSGWLLTSVLLLGTIALVSPQQLPVVIYKLALITLAAVLGYWLDRSLFPKARPGQYLKHDDRLMAEGILCRNVALVWRLFQPGMRSTTSAGCAAVSR